MNRVRAAFFNFTPPAPPDDDISGYLRWHALDHMPEQYQLAGILHGTRWMADDGCRDARLVGRGTLTDVGSIVNYLVTEPVQPTHDDFMELGPRLAHVGRFPEYRPTLQLSMPALLRWYAAPRVQISAEVVPFRPHRGVLVMVEEPAGDTAPWHSWLHREHYPALLDLPAVAGVWMYGSTAFWRLSSRCWQDAHYVTVVYLDEDPERSARNLAPVVEQRWASGAVTPTFAGPLRSMVRWDVWPE